MNKKIVLAFFIGFMSFSTHAQVNIAREGGMMIFRKSEKSVETIDGSQYTNDKYGSAKVNEGSEYHNIRYNNYKDVMEYENEKKEILELIPDKNVIIEFANGNNFYYKTFKNSNKEENSGYLLLISSSENVNFYSSNRIKYKPGKKASNSYERDSSPTFYADKTTYFIEIKGQVYQVSKTKDVEKLFPNKSAEVKKYFKENGTDFSKENEVKKMIAFLNSIS